MVIRVATYNIRKAIGTDRIRKPARILDVIGEVDADIIALQEADRRFGSRVSAIPHEMIIHQSRYHPVPLITKTDGIGWHGNAILVDDDIRIADHDVIAIPSLEPRGAVLLNFTAMTGACAWSQCTLICQDCCGGGNCARSLPISQSAGRRCQRC